MAVVNWTGAQGNATMARSDENHITANLTQNAGTTLTIEDNQIIRFDGNYNWTSSTSGGVSCIATATTRVSFQPNGAASTWPAVVSQQLYWYNNGSTGAQNWSYIDFYQCTAAPFSDATLTIDNCRFWQARNAAGGFRAIDARPAGGAYTITNCVAYGVRDTAFYFGAGTGTHILQNLDARGSETGFILAQSAGTWTISEIKAIACATGVNFSNSIALTITNVAVIECGASFSGTPTVSTTLVRPFVLSKYNASAAVAIWNPNPGVGVTLTITEPYTASGQCIGWYQNTLGNHARMVVSGGVDTRVPGGMNFLTGTSRHIYCTTNEMDFVVPQCEQTTLYMIAGGTLDNCYLAGWSAGWVGSVPTPSGDGTPMDNWAEANFLLNVDDDSGNTTSTHQPKMYGSLASNRTNPRTTPNKPLTISTISSGTPDSESATITFTTGIRARSRILLSTTSGVTRANATMVSPWKYHGILDPELVDFTLPVTSHSHALVNLKANTTYYYVIECYDPCGRRFLSTEQSFATTAAAGGGAGRSQFAGAGMRVS